MAFVYLDTSHHSFMHLTFAIAFGLCSYNFFRAMTLDPGTCPKPVNDSELKMVLYLFQPLS